ncbi:MAG: hypothetical protein RBU23_00335 [Candidatus Auribacterota bacterium]|nr:hypothetical protein [Candidatus Auribacterota bacterium]
MKLVDVVGVILTIFCIIIGFFTAFLFAQITDSLFPYKELLEELVMYLMMYLIPRIWLGIIVKHPSKLSFYFKSQFFLCYKKLIILLLPWCLCFCLLVISVSSAKQLFNLFHRNETVIENLKERYK